MTEDTKPRILLVEDSAFNRTLLTEALDQYYTILPAKDGETALEIAFGKIPPDLVLLDIILPGMDGHEVCIRLKQDPSTQDIPVIFITAMTEEEDETKGLEMGAVDYITKPFSTPIVKARVRTHIELKRQSDILRDLSTIDGLTGVANRRRFDETFSTEWMRARRNKSSFAVVMADIDHFKAYNDNYGHGQGDLCLKAVAKALKSAVHRPADFFARYGGEEFVAVLPNTTRTGAELLTEDMRQAVLELNLPHEYSQAADIVTVSLGVAVGAPSSQSTAAAFLKLSDDMLYKAKENGRNRFELEEFKEDQ